MAFFWGILIWKFQGGGGVRTPQPPDPPLDPRMCINLASAYQTYTYVAFVGVHVRARIYSIKSNLSMHGSSYIYFDLDKNQLWPN